MAGPAGPGARSRHGRGVLLLRGDREPVETWLRRGQVATRVLTVPGWTVVVPAEDTARSAPPYDDPLTLLASRRVPGRLRTSVGMFATGGRFVATVQTSGWRTVQRWLVWQPGTGVARTPALTLARPQDLVAAAGVGDRVTEGDVLRVLAAGADDAAGMLEKVVRVLDLPVAGLLDDRDLVARADLVEPTDKAVRRFDRVVGEEATQRAETERDHGPRASDPRRPTPDQDRDEEDL